MENPDFWDNREKATDQSRELSELKELVKEWEEKIKEIENLEDLLELAQKDKEISEEVEDKLKKIERDIEKEEKLLFLSGKHDENNAILTVQAGAGGTESQDWVEMLLRMYLRWAEKKGFQAKVLSITSGQEAGLKNVTLKIEGRYTFGLLSKENGVHRLVRVSPFSSQGLRHTSFAYVEVLPEIKDLGQVEINPSDLRIDTYRASGPGGQYVNKTESAVRITHIPTNLVVTSQSERSQGANKEQALKLLASRLQQLLEKQHKEKIDELRGESVSIEWGSQIRSYVLHPYKMVKDHRTNYETSQAEDVLDGDLDEFIEASLALK